MELSKEESGILDEWKSKIPGDAQWVIDAPLLYNNGTYLYYLKNCDKGLYLEHTNDQCVTIGTYEKYGPRITDAIFTEVLSVKGNFADATAFIKRALAK